MLVSSTRAGLRFCPLEHIRILSKQLDRAISECQLIKPQIPVSESRLIVDTDNIMVLDVNVSCGSKVGSVQSQKVIEKCQGFRVMIFTDGSVCGGIVGSGACAAVLVTISDNQEVQVRTSVVGCKVSSFECEVEGIILGVNMAI